MFEYLMKLEFPFPFVKISTSYSCIFNRHDPIEKINDKKINESTSYYRIIQHWGDNDVISQIYMTGVLKTVSVICAKSPNFL